MLTNIASSLGIGSGIDTAALVRDLAEAARAPREAAILQAEARNRAQVSALASASSALDTFANALSSLFDGPGFYGTLKSSDESKIGVALRDGARPSDQPLVISVTRLAAEQVSRSATRAAADTAIGNGSIRMTTAKGVFTVALTPGETSLNDIASAINAADTGVTVSVAQDAAGYRLVMQGETGAANAFSLATVAGNSAALNSLITGTTSARAAANARIVMNGVTLDYATNVIETAAPGVRLTLRGVTTAAVTVTNEPPESTIRDLMTEYVSAYNQLRTALNSAVAPGAAGSSGGPLAGDSAIRDMMQSLARMNLTPLDSSGDVRTLSDLGIQTGRDGTLTFNTAKFDTAYAADPERVRAILDPATGSDTTPGIAGALDSIRDRLQDPDGPLAGSRKRYASAAETLTKSREKMEANDLVYRAQLEKSFTAMERQMVLLRSTQSYITQQIAAWNSSDS